MRPTRLTAYLRVAAFAVAVATPAIAVADGIEVSDAVAYETNGKVGGGYMVITNTGTQSDALIGVRGAFPKVMLHATTQQDGVASMRHVARFDIAPGGQLIFAPGGNHVMFMGLSAPFTVGETVPATLEFERAGDVDVNFKVIARTATPGDGAAATK